MPMNGQDRRYETTARLSAAVLSLAIAIAPSALLAREITTLKATYVIAIGTAVIGHATAESRFSGENYTAAINGSTGGVSRLVSDARASLSGSGKISGKTVLPATFNLETVERGFGTHVSMAMQGGRITNLVAVPRLSAAADRIPITQSHKTGIVDPLSAFIVPLDRPGVPSGRAACDRTIKVFDGWTRFDVQLFYKQTKAVDGGADTYAGRIIVCGARYVPVAGHRAQGDSLNDLVDNDRLEVWLVPVENTALLVPFRILIGTSWGDLIVYATRFTTTATEERAEAD
ncbi:DUF3108 domain-containing protein [Bauldia litoralis]|nr:DUF3108 domain-containing protein [Bauldia litoralis]